MNIIALDIETHDPNLKELGDGAIRRDGKILGVGFYSSLGSGYVEPDDPDLLHIFADPSWIKVFHNAIYDLSWLINGYGFTFKGKLEDTMTRAYLLDAYQNHYDLDSCAQRMGLEGKNKGQTIEEWWKTNGGKGKAVENLVSIPRAITAAYCQQDCRATYELYMAQQPLIEKEDLQEANDRECELLPLLMYMKKNGIRIDDEARNQLANNLNMDLGEIKNELYKRWHIKKFSTAAANADLTAAWKQEGLPLKVTATGRPSFAAEVIDEYKVGDKWNHDLPRLVHSARAHETCLGKFVEGSLLDYQVNGRIHPTYIPTKHDEGGTKTGRFSCRNPNMQQVSARDDKFGSSVRGLLLPEEDCLLGAFDYKQIEYITFLHYAEGEAAEAARKVIWENESFSYHDYVMELMGWTRKDQRMDAKTLNFGTIYGLGVKGLAQRLHREIADMKIIMEQYHQFVPFAKPTTQSIQRVGISRGFVRTLGKRKQRLSGISYGQGPIVDNSQAYKLVNYLVQGSCSDILKMGLLDAWKAGIFASDALVLHLTVHDENVVSIPRTKRGYEAMKEFEKAMCSPLELRVPIRIDKEVGPNWGSTDKGGYRDFCTEALKYSS